MATHYVWDEGTAHGKRLRDGIEAYRDAKHKLEWELGAMNQMTNAEVQTVYGFADGTIDGVAKTNIEMATAAKAELAADIGRLANNGSQSNFALALQQMLDQFA